MCHQDKPGPVVGLFVALGFKSGNLNLFACVGPFETDVSSYFLSELLISVCGCVFVCLFLFDVVLLFFSMTFSKQPLVALDIQFTCLSLVTFSHICKMNNQNSTRI